MQDVKICPYAMVSFRVTIGWWWYEPILVDGLTYIGRDANQYRLSQ